MPDKVPGTKSIRTRQSLLLLLLTEVPEGILKAIDKHTSFQLPGETASVINVSAW